MYQLSPRSNRLLNPANTYNTPWDQRGCWLMSHKDILGNTEKVTAVPDEWKRQVPHPCSGRRIQGITDWTVSVLEVRVNPL